MSRVFLVFVLIVAVVAELGFYIGWFHLSSGSDDNNAHLTVSVGKGQVQKDMDKAADKVKTTPQQAEE
jgi:hypothetical protein